MTRPKAKGAPVRRGSGLRRVAPHVLRCWHASWAVQLRVSDGRIPAAPPSNDNDWRLLPRYTALVATHALALRGWP